MPATFTSVLDNLDALATIAGGLFAGSALFVTAVEVPAIRELGVDQHWQFFPLMYERAAISQAAFAAIASVAGILHGIRITGAPSDRNLWIAAGTAFLGLLPYTVICMFPTNHFIINDNKRIKSANESQIDIAKKKELLDKWAVLHLVRTVASAAGFGAMIFGLSRHSSLLLKW
jgi:uncharacterized membrane protein